MKNTFRRKLLSFEAEISAKIEDLIYRKKKGKESDNTHERVLKLKPDQQFNLSGGHYVKEISKDAIFDENGYSYNHSCLTLDERCEIIDSFL